MTITEIIIIIQLFYGIPSIFLMIFFIFLLGIDKDFENSFYRLVQCDLILNILCYLNTWFALRLENSDFGLDVLLTFESFVTNMSGYSRFLCTIFFHIQNVTGYSLFLHRYTVVTFLNSESLWRRFYLLVPIFAIVYSFLVLAPWWATGNYVITTDIVNNSFRKTYNGRAMTFQTCVITLFAMFYFLMILTTGMLTTMNASIKMQNGKSKRICRYIQKLTRIAFVNSVLMSGNLFLTLIASFFLLSPFRAIARLNFIIANTFTSDMFTLAMPYILLVFDGNVQRIFRFRKKDSELNYIVKNNVPTITN